MTVIPIPQLECLRCGHKWVARKAHVKKCPKCKSRYWDVPKDQKVLVKGPKGDSSRQKHLISVKSERHKVT